MKKNRKVLACFLSRWRPHKPQMACSFIRLYIYIIIIIIVYVVSVGGPHGLREMRGTLFFFLLAGIQCRCGASVANWIGAGVQREAALLAFFCFGAVLFLHRARLRHNEPASSPAQLAPRFVRVATLRSFN